MENVKEGKVLIRVSAIYMTIFAILYLILGVIAVIADVEGLGAAHGSGDVLVIVLAYGTAILALLAAIIGFRTASEAMKPNLCKIIGVILAAFGLISAIYIQIAQDKFELFDILVMVCGIFYIMGAKKIQEN